jgi:hypothetical protein
MTKKTVIIPMSCLVFYSCGGFVMPNTVVWDVSSGFLMAIVLAYVCVELAKMLYGGKDKDTATIVALTISLILISGVGVCMLAWSIMNLPKAWLLLSW